MDDGAMTVAAGRAAINGGSGAAIPGGAHPANGGAWAAIAAGPMLRRAAKPQQQQQLPRQCHGPPKSHFRSRRRAAGRSRGGARRGAQPAAQPAAEEPPRSRSPLSGIVALWSLALLAFERYFVICRPLGNIRLRGKHAALGIAFVWVFSFIWTIPPTMGWSSYTTSKIGTTCEPNWYSGDYNDHTFIITFFTTCFILPLMVILVSYGKLMRKLKKVSDTQGRLGSTRKPERQVTRMVVIMIIAFLICWSPYAAFSILVTACPSIELDARLAAIPAFFSKTATVYNPIIYVFMNNQFRRCLIQLFRCRDQDGALSKANVVSDRAMLTNSKSCGEVPTLAAQITVYDQRSEDEHSSCHSFAQLAISENKVCPV